MDNDEVINLINRTGIDTTLDAIKWVIDKNLKNHIKGHPFREGDKIEFTGGYNRDIRYKAMITGVDEEGNLYLPL